LMIAESQDQYDFLSQKCEREIELGLEVAMLDRDALSDIAPYLGEVVYGAEFCAQEGKVNPLLANAAITNWAKAAGVEFLADNRVQAIEKNGWEYKVSWGEGSLTSPKIVLAAGGGNRALAAELGLALPVISEPLHMNITESVAPFIGHLVQHAARAITLKQFGSGHIVIGGGWPAQLRTGDNYPSVKLASIIGNTTLAQHIIPQIAPLRIIRTWAGINATTDGCPVLGEFSASPGLYAAVSGDAGYTLGPFCARLLAGEMLGEAPTEDIADFTPDRYRL
jgi:glycine/D-amino acid oxidase-like deaminating enzyme